MTIFIMAMMLLDCNETGFIFITTHLAAGDGQCVGSVDKIMMIDTKYTYINIMSLPSDTY